MVTTINIDNAAYLNITGIYTGHSWQLVLEQYEDDETTPKNYEGVYTFIICRDNARKERVLVLTEGSGLTVVDNSLTILRTRTQNKLSAGIYYYDLHDDVDIDSSYPFIRGSLIVTASR